jgi:hypothetical protein
MLDQGMGQIPARMHETLLSLGQSDKAAKPYLIAVFGQVGPRPYEVCAESSRSASYGKAYGFYSCLSKLTET